MNHSQIEKASISELLAGFQKIVNNCPNIQKTKNTINDEIPYSSESSKNLKMSLEELNSWYKRRVLFPEHTINKVGWDKTDRLNNNFTDNQIQSDDRLN